MTPTADLVTFVKAWEGCSLKPYLDPAGLPTIGYGHRIPSMALVKWTQEQADAQLSLDLEVVGKKLTTLVGELTQQEFDACCSLIFNIGVGAFRMSTLRIRLTEGNAAGAAAQFPAWCKITVDGKKVVSEGLVKRRRAEQAIFLSADYSGRP